ncbi:uncharacterized protein MELLADRAFT_60679 [Melampsora larici-populina 98AG31]|uniref:Secreted protein n=1 Tax=Melampsora larici-populina (strain 98AG31 / pathotype 3-4-7) TaxID=747676 RepID=F4RBX9_MELLP|nr:uncharacterized protein MELLADRAFT_60679 [Melampsora larici-populina 98AG31]EGG10183.1 hypothetical protein MELLADRAFT_60679 [Melampsora larici-populina 98AG31]
MRSTYLSFIHSCLLAFIYTADSNLLTTYASPKSISRSLVNTPLRGKKYKRELSSNVAELPGTVESLERLTLKGTQFSDKNPHITQSRSTSSPSSVGSAPASQAILDWHPTTNFPDPSEHFNAMNDHLCVGLHSYASERTRRPTISELFATSKSHIAHEDATLERLIPATLEVKLQDIINSGDKEWYKDQKVLNSWKKIGVEAEHKELLIVVGEAVQIWSNDFLKTMEKWTPDFRTIWPSLPLKTVPGATQLTKSTPLKNLEMLSRALSSVDLEIKEKVYAWYRRIMGGKNFDNRLMFLKENHNRIGEEIAQALVDSFSALLYDRESISRHLALLEEVSDLYPGIRAKFVARVVAMRDQAKAEDKYRFRKAVFHIDDSAASLETYNYLEKNMKKVDDWPYWSYDEAVEIHNRQPSFSRSIYQLPLKEPFYQTRLAQAESFKDGLVGKTVDLMRKIMREDKSKSVLLELQWLRDILERLNLADRKAIHEDAQFILALKEREYYESFSRGCIEAVQFTSQELADIFVLRHSFTSSQALEALFTIQHMKSAPSSYHAAVLKVRQQMRSKHYMDFDQKYEWLQDLSQSAAVNMLATNYKNFISISEKPSFSSITGLEQNLIFHNFDLIYENNPRIKKKILSQVREIVGPTSMTKVAKIIRSSLRQVWTRDTWNIFVDGKLGYSQEDPIYHEIYKLGKVIQLGKEWPSFSENGAKEAYATYKNIHNEVKLTVQSILNAEFNERVRLLAFAAKREKNFSPDDGSSTSFDQLTSSDQISQWSRQGLTATVMLELVKALRLENKKSAAGESWRLIADSEVLTWLKFFETPEGKNSIELKELSRLFEKLSSTELELRLWQVREKIVSSSPKSFDRILIVFKTLMISLLWCIR